MKRLLRLLTLLGVILFLAACNSDEAGNNQKDPEDKDKDKVVEEELADYDFKGLTLKWGAPWLREIDPNASEFNERWSSRIEELEEKWNFNFEVTEIGWDDYVGNYIRTTLAGDPVADIVYMLTPQFYPNLVDNGIVYPVSDLGIIDYDDVKWNQTSREASEYKGKEYSLSMNGINTRDGIWWNKTLFDQLGLPDLYEVYENDEWTWEKMIEIAEAATKDTNNDGETDIYGFAAENLPWKLIYSNGYESIQKTDAGIEINMNDPKVIEALEFYQNYAQNKGFVERGWYDGANWDFRYTDFANGMIAMVSAEWWVSNSYFVGKMEDEYGFVPFPSGPSNNVPVSYGYEAALEVMLQTVESPKEKVTIWDAILDVGSEDDWKRWLINDFEQSAGDAQTVEYALMLNDFTKTNLIRGFENINTIFNNFFGELASGSTTVQTGLEAIDPQIQAALEDFQKNGADLGIDEE